MSGKCTNTEGILHLLKSPAGQNILSMLIINGKGAAYSEGYGQEFISASWRFDWLGGHIETGFQFTCLGKLEVRFARTPQTRTANTAQQAKRN